MRAASRAATYKMFFRTGILVSTQFSELKYILIVKDVAKIIFCWKIFIMETTLSLSTPLNIQTNTETIYKILKDFYGLKLLTFSGENMSS